MRRCPGSEFRACRSLLGAVLIGGPGLAGGPTALADIIAIAHEKQTLHVAGIELAVQVPRGYRLELLTSRLRGPRLLAFGAQAELFVGSRSGNVYRLTPPYDAPHTLVQLTGYPHSVARRGAELLIARTDGLYSAPYQPGQAVVEPATIRLLAALPPGGNHSSRTVKVSPEGRIFLSLGISSNCTDNYLGPSYPFSARRGGVMWLSEDGDANRWIPYASGLRNPIGFDWHPQTRVLYASNNGPDHLGFELPPEYFSKLAPGSFHGMPWFQYDGERIRRDPCIGSLPPRARSEVRAPVATFPARNAPMDVVFVPGGAMETAFVGDAIVALHGSWGTAPSGSGRGDPATRRHPKLVLVRFTRGEARRVDDLVTGFQLADGSRWARPVGTAIGPDGALYFTSDGGINGLFRLIKRDH